MLKEGMKMCSKGVDAGAFGAKADRDPCHGLLQVHGSPPPIPWER